MAILSVGTLRPFASRALGLVPGSKSSIGTSSLFGDTGGKALTTPTFSLGEGGLSRTNTEFLDASRQSLADLRANRARFGEGFTAFRTARLQAVENARARGVGNLRSQLGRRGILGASFAQDAITRKELDFVREADRVNAEVDVAEFEFNLKSLAQESQIAQANLSRELTEFGMVAQFVTNLNSFETRRLEAQLDLAAAAFRNRTGTTSRTRIGGSRFGPGGPLGSFGFGSPTNFAGPATFGATTLTPIQTSPFTGPLSFGNTFQQPPQTTSSFPTIA